jgi:hypothetical protein
MTSPLAAAASPARLLIHADDDPRTGGRRFESGFQRLRAIHATGPWSDKRATLRLQIDDLQGHRVHSADHVGPLLDVTLPAGTYHISVQHGKFRRKYTMALEPGTSFNLHLRIAPEET